MSSLPDNAPSPRLCHIIQWSDFAGYGFNLHAEKSKPGQFIGKIDNNSPAEMAGLKEGDRIIEVNGVNIGNENHKQVVTRIKAVAKETKLLVLDLETDSYYKGKNIVVRGDQSNITYGSSNRDAALPPPPPEIATNGHHEEADTRSVSSHASSSAASEASTQPQDDGSIQGSTTSNSEPTEAAHSRHSSVSTSYSTESPQETNQDDQENQPVAPVEEVSAAPVPEEEVAPAPPASDPPTEEEAQPVAEEETKPVEDNSSVEEAEAAVVEDKEEVQLSKELEKTSIVEEVHSESGLSDLEAEYDNVNIRAQVAAATQVVNGVSEEVVAAPVESGEAAVMSSRRSSVSSSKSSVSATSAASRSSQSSAHTDPSTQSPMSTSPTPPPSLDTISTKTPEPVSTPTPEPEPITTTTTTTTLNNATNNESSKQPLANRNSFNASGLNLNMTAQEMRAHLASKKKIDPRKETMDLKKKYEIIQNM